MQTYTHIPIGALVGALAFPHDLRLQLACIAASVAPDLVMIPTYLMDRAGGKQPLAQQSKWLLILKECSHSLLLCLALAVLALTRGSDLLSAVSVGWLVHIVVDIFSHGDPRFQVYGDPHYLWPFGSLRAMGVCDYRIAVGQLWPVKPFELAVLIASGLGTMLIWFLY